MPTAGRDHHGVLVEMCTWKEQSGWGFGSSGSRIWGLGFTKINGSICRSFYLQKTLFIHDFPPRRFYLKKQETM